MSAYKTVWSVIHSNFKNTIEDSSTGVNSLTSISISFSESTDAVDLKKQPSSIFNGKYSIQLDAMNSYQQDLATGVVDFDYNIRLQTAFEINQNDITEYHEAIYNLEELIRKRLDYDTWINSSIINIQFLNGNKFQFIPSVDLERFSIVELVFNVTGRTNINS